MAVGLLGGILMTASSLFGEGEATTGKCLTPFVISARLRPLENLILQRRVLAGRPLNELSALSPSGRFRIHYDTSSASQNLPAMLDGAGNRIPLSTMQYVDNVAMTFDSVWMAEITTFNFPPPPADNNAGGGDEYDIYIQDLGANNFGYTQPETEIPDVPAKPNPRWTSYIVIDNDFGVGFRTRGIPAVHVTAAHEFFHAIQLGGYGLWDDNEIYFYELTAEAMESVVFPSVKDYVKDIYTYFNVMDLLPLYDNDKNLSYGRAIWGVYLVQQYGIQIMKSVWEQIASQKPFAALDKALQLRNTSLEQAFTTFSLWNFFTGIRADTIHYYKDGNLFPPWKFSETGNITFETQTFVRTSKSYTMQYVRAVRNSDTVDFKISNVNTVDALADSHQVFGYSLAVSPNVVSGWSALPNGISYSFIAGSLLTWRVLLGTDSLGVFPLLSTSPFPNPFRPKETPAIYFPLSSSRISEITLYIFSSDFELQAQMTPRYDYEKKSVVWNGKNNKGELVGSGIYFYILKGEEIEVKGKFAVVQ